MSNLLAKVTRTQNLKILKKYIIFSQIWQKCKNLKNWWKFKKFEKSLKFEILSKFLKFEYFWVLVTTNNFYKVFIRKNRNLFMKPRRRRSTEEDWRGYQYGTNYGCLIQGKSWLATQVQNTKTKIHPLARIYWNRYPQWLKLLIRWTLHFQSPMMSCYDPFGLKMLLNFRMMFSFAHTPPAIEMAAVEPGLFFNEYDSKLIFEN